MAGSNIRRTGTAAVLIALAAGTGAPASATELSLSYFMGLKHPMNRAVFTPFAKKLAEVSGGKLTVKQYPGGALNSSPPKQYSILLKGVADIAFALPGYTGNLFPVTNTVTIPGVCADALDCTKAMWRAMPLIEKEFKAKLLAVWANDIPVLLTRKKAVRSVADLKGMKVRVTSKQDVPFMEALGASAVSQPVTVINRNLANGTIDAIAIDPSAIRSFKLWEPANYVTIGLPGSGSAFVLMMNQGVYNEDERAGKSLGGRGVRPVAVALRRRDLQEGRSGRARLREEERGRYHYPAGCRTGQGERRNCECHGQIPQHEAARRQDRRRGL